MELVALLRLLWRFRIAVAVGAVVAVGLGFMATRGPTSRFGVASMRVMLDTPLSETVDANPTGASTLEWRASLFADLMSTQPTRLRIARQMGISPSRLVVTAPYMAVPEVPVPLARAALDAASVIPAPYQLGIQAATLLPIVRIDARAPTREQAGRLAVAGADALKADTATPAGPNTEQFVVHAVGPVRAREIVNHPRHLIAALVVCIVFGLWCAGITLIGGLSSLRHRSSATRAPSIGWS